MTVKRRRLQGTWNHRVTVCGHPSAAVLWFPSQERTIIAAEVFEGTF